MLPVLLSFGPVKIYTFGVFLVLSFFWASFLLWRLIRLTSFKEEDVFDGLFWSLAGGIFLGRLIYVILNFNQFGFNILKFILINGYPGFSIFGVIFGGLLTLLLFCYHKKIKYKELIDYFIPSIFLAFGLGKLGGFFSGEEIGTVTKFLLRIRYVGNDGLRHLTSFYECLLFLAGAFLAYKIIFLIRKEKLNQGMNLYFFLWYFSLVYFVFDKLKGYHLYFLSYSFNWGVSLIIVLILSFYFLYYFRNSINIYVQKTWKNIYHRTKNKIRGGQDKNSPAN